MSRFRMSCWTAALTLACGLAGTTGEAFAQMPVPAHQGIERRLSLTRSASPLGSSRTLSMDVSTGDRTAIRFHASYDQFASFPDDENFERFGRPTMKLRTIPIGVDYVVHLADPDRRIVPVASAGVAVNLSRLSVVENIGMAPSVAPAEVAAAVPFSALVTASPERDSQMGVGYDVHAALGLRTNINQSVFVIGQARLRHLDALAFSKDDFAEFNKLDFVLGVGFRF